MSEGLNASTAAIPMTGTQPHWSAVYSHGLNKYKAISQTVLVMSES